MAQHNDTGKWGEDLAAEKLTAEGYAIVERNWRSNGFDIDIVAKKGTTVVFAEVKTRKDKAEDPLEAIDSKKISHLARGAACYLDMHPEPWVPRFDLFAVRGTPEDFELEHLEDAFLPPLKKY